MRLSIVFSILTILSLESIGRDISAPLDSIGATKLNGKMHIRYLVSPGETIYGISSKYHVSVSDLLELNTELENGLKVGQVIHIPYEPVIEAPARIVKNENLIAPAADEKTKATAAVPPATKKDLAVVEEKPSTAAVEKRVVHTVQSGETLYSLSKKYNVSVNDLLKWNNMDLKVGQEIVVTVPQSQEKVEVATTKGTTKEIVRSESPALKVVKDNFSENESGKKYDYDSSMQQILIIPFDPYLYFSDADDEIAATSKIPRTKVRQVFRRRMNALLDHPAYENIHLLGGKSQDSLTDLNKIYGSVTYNYQEILYNPNNKILETNNASQDKKSNKTWLDKQKEKFIADESTGKAITAKDNGKYFGVIIRNNEFFKYFNNKYNIDYYIFVNQFEVKTNYENCLDRAAQNYERTFTTHYSIFDASGKQIAGNKFRTHYNSNANNVNQIVGDNMQKITSRILADLPVPKK